jgi:monoamine oxidase
MSWSRRRLLGHLGLGALGAVAACARPVAPSPGDGDKLAAPTPTAPPRPTTRPLPRRADVLVVGAGLAGLRAHALLRTKGKSSFVLEARERVGGRVLTRRVGGTPIELGATSLYDVSDDPLVARAREGQLRLESLAGRTRVFSVAGEERSLSSHQERVERLFDLLALARTKSDPSQPVRDALESIIGRTRRDRDRLGIEQALTTEIELLHAADATELALGALDEGGSEDRPRLRVVGGLDQLVAQLARGADVRLGQVVQAIRLTQEGVEVETHQGQFQGRAVIVTLPLGVLKARAVRFEPALPEDVQGAIDRLGMGGLTKVVARFPRRFWPRDVDRLARTPALEERGQWALAEDVSAPEAPWLSFVNAGRFARELERLPERVLAERVHATLREMFGADAPAPLEVVKSTWNDDPYARGALSFLAAGATLEDRITLSRPIEGRVVLAGEATSVEAPATVHGAYLSAQQAVDDVVAALAEEGRRRAKEALDTP